MTRKDQRTGGDSQPVWFVGHLAAVYVIVIFCSPSLAGLTRGKLLPLLVQRPTSSGFEFFFSYIFVFSFVPAFLLGLLSDRCRKVAQYVWVVPTAILAYKFATFAAPSVLQSQFSTSFHQFFGGGFLIPEFQNQRWRDFWSIVSSNPDMTRGLDQFWFTAPFYAGVGYSLAAWIGLRTKLGRRIALKPENGNSADLTVGDDPATS